MNLESSRTSFFTSHPKFESTSTVSSNLARLDFRYRHIIEQNRNIIEGKTVLDIASHDGRFSFAALKGGAAKKVIGIEARESLVKDAEETFAFYGADRSRYEFIAGDIFDELEAVKSLGIETAMILGFMYHTARQYEVIHALSDAGVSNIIIDCNVLQRAKGAVMKLRMEGTEKDSQIWDAARPKALSAVPSAKALRLLLIEFGYKPSFVRPTGDVADIPRGYLKERRVTIVGSK